MTISRGSGNNKPAVRGHQNTQIKTSEQEMDLKHGSQVTYIHSPSQHTNLLRKKVQDIYKYHNLQMMIDPQAMSARGVSFSQGALWGDCTAYLCLCKCH